MFKFVCALEVTGLFGFEVVLVSVASTKSESLTRLALSVVVVSGVGGSACARNCWQEAFFWKMKRFLLLNFQDN